MYLSIGLASIAYPSQCLLPLTHVNTVTIRFPLTPAISRSLSSPATTQPFLSNLIPFCSFRSVVERSQSLKPFPLLRLRVFDYFAVISLHFPLRDI